MRFPPAFVTDRNGRYTSPSLLPHPFTHWHCSVRAAMPWYVSALCEMNGGSVSLHLLTGGGRGRRRGGNETDINIDIPAHKYFTKINVWKALKKYAVSAMMETQKEKPL